MRFSDLVLYYRTLHRIKYGLDLYSDWNRRGPGGSINSTITVIGPDKLRTY
jgi:hypothetical protein